jgi:Rrf2 family iron-sulfur cluster assembly transcriptional regulator
MTHDLWMSLNARIYDYLDSVHLQELVTTQLKKEADEAAGIHKPHAHPHIIGSAEIKAAQH